MKIIDLLNSGKVTVSCELFPPKKGSELKKAEDVVRKMAKLHPSFLSVTYGAGGGTSAYTVHLADEAQNHCGVTALAHLTCASADRETIRRMLEELRRNNIQNILALRGDLPGDGEYPTPRHYRYAGELAREIREDGDFCVGGACYPEGHPESPSIELDLDAIKY